MCLVVYVCMCLIKRGGRTDACIIDTDVNSIPDENVRACARMHLRMYGKRSGRTYSPACGTGVGFGPGHICVRVRLLQSDDGKKRTRAHPFESLSFTDGENQPGGSLSSLCNPRRESGNKLGSRESAPRWPRDRRSSRRRAAHRPRPALQRRPQVMPNRPR